MSGQVSFAAFLIVGLLIGAGLVSIVNYANGGTTHTVVSDFTEFATTSIVQTVTTTSVQTVTSTAFQTVTEIVSQSVSVAQISAMVSSCQHDNATGEYCTVVLTNTGNANTSTTGSQAAAGACSLTFVGVTHTGYEADTLAHALANADGGETIDAGGTATVVCDAPGSQAPPGAQVTGTILLIDGGEALFSTTAS